MRKVMFHYDVLKSVGVVALAASLPLHVHISSVLIGTLAVLTVLKLVHDRRFPSEGITILSLGFVALFLLELIGLSYTEPSNLRLGFSTLEKHMSLVMIPFIFIDFFPTDQERRRILVGLVVTVVLASIVAVVSNVLISIDEYERFFHEWRFSHDRISEPIGLQA